MLSVSCVFNMVHKDWGLIMDWGKSLIEGKKILKKDYISTFLN